MVLVNKFKMIVQPGLMAFQTAYLDEARATMSYKRKIYQLHKYTTENIPIKHTHLSMVLPSIYYLYISSFLYQILSHRVTTRRLHSTASRCLSLSYLYSPFKMKCLKCLWMDLKVDAYLKKHNFSEAILITYSIVFCVILKMWPPTNKISKLHVICKP